MEAIATKGAPWSASAHHTSASRALLASALAFTSDRPDARVLILTGDTGLYVKAPGRRMDMVMPADWLELADEHRPNPRGNLASTPEGFPILRG